MPRWCVLQMFWLYLCMWQNDEGHKKYILFRNLRGEWRVEPFLSATQLPLEKSGKFGISVSTCLWSVGQAFEELFRFKKIAPYGTFLQWWQICSNLLTLQPFLFGNFMQLVVLNYEFMQEKRANAILGAWAI
jgi:hypothetical protein